MAAGEDLARELEAEQRVVSMLYAHLDALMEATEQRRADVRRTPAAGTPGSHNERDALTKAYEQRLAQLRAVEDRLCFGRIDLRGGERRYVGRLGLSDELQTPVLIDWRAPAAEPFYQATAATPGEVIRRRHITTKGRTVTAVEDEVLDLDALDPEETATLAGEGALIAALDEHRSGRMRDIVSTIQAEQDRVIRAPLQGILVVQGGPGTGKTAVALHRAAFLLYTHRERIARSGVLLVGPNQPFLRYIEQVLPSLGETGVVTATQGELFAGVTAHAEEEPRTAALKGDVRMARVIRSAIQERQRIPEQAKTLRVDSHRVVLRRQDVGASRARARATGKPHNEARAVFVKDLLYRLAKQLAEVLRHDPNDEDHSDLVADLRESPDVRREINLCWMPLTPQRLLASLWADPVRLAAAAPYLNEDQRALLHRPITAPWTAADVPLLDEAAELLGQDDSADRIEAAGLAAERRREAEYARGALEMSSAAGMLTAEALMDRYDSAGPVLSVAERAAEDRTWTFGHILVDEAQELSAMAWRLLVRRCPTKSMTVVGDLAQTGSLGGARSWAGVLDPHAAGRWTVAELTVNYRTPGLIMTVASRVLEASGIRTTPPTSAREGRWPPTAVGFEPGDWARVADVVRAEREAVTPGSLAVITSKADVGRVTSAVVRDLGREALAEYGSTVGAVSVVPVEEVKGLEFDGVVLVEPAAILAESPRGPSDLYVAMTRPTQRLVIAHSTALPEALAGLEAWTTSNPAVPDP